MQIEELVEEDNDSEIDEFEQPNSQGLKLFTQ